MREWTPITYAEGNELDCPLPEPENEILISLTNGSVEIDTFMQDDDGYYLDSGRDWKNVAAWMPLPDAYPGDMAVVDPKTGLRPCPFCGGKVSATYNRTGLYVVACEGCDGIYVNKHDKTSKEVTARWNARP